VFVGNVSYETTATELEQLFAQVGDVVEVILPADRVSGRPRGFAFVEFADGSSCQEAIARFDGYELNNRNLRVNEAEERERRPPAFSGPGPSARPRGPRGSKSKGSRRNIRSRKRGF
jgi:RNA recognition motif-containing protein